MKLSDKDKPFIKDLLKQGASYRQVAAQLGCDKDTVGKFVARNLPDHVRKPRKKRTVQDAKRILVLDIETRPALAYVWGVWNQNIGPHQIVEDKATISFAAKWLGESGVFFASDNTTGGHEAMVEQLWHLLDEADAVVHYNGAKFDIPHIQQEFWLAGFVPPGDFFQIDLLKTIRTEFNFTSNKLDNIARQLNIGKKIENEGFSLWTKCLEGDDAAWERMRKYNIQDVKLTEELYGRLGPWLKQASYPRRRLDNQTKFWEA